MLKETDIKIINFILNYLFKNGYECRPIWKPMHNLHMFKKCPRDNLSGANEIYKRVINLPSSQIFNFYK